MNIEFTDGLLLEQVILWDGAEICLGEGMMAMGHAKEMIIVMQPSHGGMAPWIRVIWSEEGCPDWYINMATVQRVVLKQ